MNPQEQEHWDHEMGRASEWQNAHAWSIMNLGPDRSHAERLHAECLTRAGKFVVLCEDEVCCPVTDGFIRAETSIYAVCDTLAEAEEIANQEEGAPIWVYRLPEPKPPVAPAEPQWDDECPF